MLAPPELGVPLLELLAEALEELDALVPELAEALVVVVCVPAVVAVVPVCVGGAWTLELGTVSGGASTVSAAAGVLELPQPTSATPAASMASAAKIRRLRALKPLSIGKLRRRAAPSGGRSGGSR